MQDEGERYDHIAPYYDLTIKPLDAIIGGRRRELLSHARGEVLEVGIGTGRTLPQYPTDVHITGIDPAAKMLAVARRRAQRLGLAVDLQVMSAEHLRFPAASFHTVVSSLAFCSIPDPDAALREIRRVLRPGGQLLLVEHIRPRGGLGWLFDHLDPWYYRVSCHLNRQLPAHLVQAGYVIRRDERWLHGMFMVVQATI
jgi:phosphatidylethanolamine/phosphatidyl-N-methylethanolamine N-methyltransferase